MACTQCLACKLSYLFGYSELGEKGNTASDWSMICVINVAEAFCYVVFTKLITGIHYKPGKLTSRRQVATCLFFPSRSRQLLFFLFFFSFFQSIAIIWYFGNPYLWYNPQLLWLFAWHSKMLRMQPVLVNNTTLWGFKALALYWLLVSGSSRSVNLTEFMLKSFY